MNLNGVILLVSLSAVLSGKDPESASSQPQTVQDGARICFTGEMTLARGVKGKVE